MVIPSLSDVLGSLEQAPLYSPSDTSRVVGLVLHCLCVGFLYIEVMYQQGRLKQFTSGPAKIGNANLSH